MSEKNHQDQDYEQYNTDSDEMESIDQNEYASRSEVYHGDEDESRDDLYMDDSPCVTTCCCCCSLGLGSIIAGVLFMVSCSFFVYLLVFGFGCSFSLDFYFRFWVWHLLKRLL